MNLILLFAEDFTSSREARVRDTRRLAHIRGVHGAQVGNLLKVGQINGAIGQGKVISVSEQELVLEVSLNHSAPPPLPITLLLGLPRPKMLKRVLQTVATLGVERLILINSYRVEKSYWQSPWLTPEAIKEQLILGLEQGGATHLPEVQLEKRFKPYVEDRLPDLLPGRRALIAHPYTQAPCPSQHTEPLILAVGPEGGWIEYEVDKLTGLGFEPVHLGSRILRVETAIPYLLGRLSGESPKPL